MADIANPDRADAGRARIDWALTEMPVIRDLMQELAREKPLQGLRLGGCLHITTETANLARTLKAAGAELVLCASNPLSTQDDVAASLVQHDDIPVFARRGESHEVYYQHIHAVLDHRPQVTLDDGADLISELHRSRPELLATMIGGTEETTTGVIRLRAMAADGALQVPVLAVNDAMTKHLFDNRYGTGQSALDGIIRATNILLAGKTFCVAGYGWCGRGVARRAAGHGAKVIVCEVEPLRALEAAMDGYRVMPLLEAAAQADFMLTVTGDKQVIDTAHFEVMKDGCVLANAGHFNVEINLEALEALSRGTSRPREHVQEYTLEDGRRIRLLAEGRLVNLAAAEGHPSAVMDMSFANQVLGVLHLVRQRGKLTPGVHAVPTAIDQQVARRKLAAMQIEIDTLTPSQQAYLASWQEGT
ncbi:adenosylhomocysteinase [Thiohalophilus thiocyanatoxydans]|uniref:Adenosylhomocysteinase n=1 Tax=Thiohalophilus thiocyanatoxydans TaxID=381308 RepID=A0A4R8IQF6_9GAMM|nr:adenosylhomocysteinase [Thiohalophilus thiocyanatoxydans]TDY02534.1 adenosylhomocysteinase [Thiohalophilus thiocyanatoxydans]